MPPRVVVASLLLLFPIAVFAVPDSVTIPLVDKKPFSKNGTAEHKLGIWLGLGGGSKKLYEFDTGAPGLYASYNPQWWHNFQVVNPVPVTQTYTSGNMYVSNIVSTKIDLGHGIPKIRAHVALVTGASGGSVGDWLTQVAAGQPPLDTYFYGDFGMDLSKGNGIFGLLPQLPGNLSSGFVVSTGGYQHPKPFLTIGLTPELRGQFTTFLKMQRKKGAGIYPGKSHPPRLVYQEELVNAFITMGTASLGTRFNTGVVLDTGAPSTALHDLNHGFNIPPALLDDKGKSVVSGTPFTMTRIRDQQSPAWLMSYIVGNKDSYNAIGVSTTALPSHTVSYTNAGLNPFFRFDVMFDLVNGRVGFRKIVAGGPMLQIDDAPSITVDNSQVLISGSALARSQLLAKIEYRVGSGSFLPAEGLNDWSFTVPLNAGQNTITVRALDISGEFTEKNIVVTREL